MRTIQLLQSCNTPHLTTLQDKGALVNVNPISVTSRLFCACTIHLCCYLVKVYRISMYIIWSEIYLFSSPPLLKIFFLLPATSSLYSNFFPYPRPLCSSLFFSYTIFFFFPTHLYISYIPGGGGGEYFPLGKYTFFQTFYDFRKYPGKAIKLRPKPH